MHPDDSHYFEQRANHALDLAQRATHPAVARAHYELAELYLERMIELRDMPNHDWALFKWAPVED